MKTKRMLSLLLIPAMLLTCLTGCAKTAGDDNAGGANGTGATEGMPTGNGGGGQL